MSLKLRLSRAAAPRSTTTPASRPEERRPVVTSWKNAGPFSGSFSKALDHRASSSRVGPLHGVLEGALGGVGPHAQILRRLHEKRHALLIGASLRRRRPMISSTLTPRCASGFRLMKKWPLLVPPLMKAPVVRGPPDRPRR